MVKIKIEPINVSNTSLSLNGKRGHRKFDANQAKKHDFGETHCVVCDKVFTKYHYKTKLCSEECRKEHRKSILRQYGKDNREKLNAYKRKHRKENLERSLNTERRYLEKNREKINARVRNFRKDNLEKVRARDRKYYAKKNEEE